MHSSEEWQQPYRELTWQALALGIVSGILLNVALIYSALKLGFAISASAIAALIGFVLLRGRSWRGTVIENNLNQTIAAAIVTAGSGVVFTLPTLFLLQSNKTIGSFSPWPLLAAGVGGALLGVVLIIPLRRKMIEIDRLRFPTGTAVATILRSGAAGSEKVTLLAYGCAIGAAWKLLLLSGWLNWPGVIENDELSLSFGLLPSYLSAALYLSPLTFASGLLAGRGGLPFFFGGVAAWWIIAPWMVHASWLNPQLANAELVEFIYNKSLRPLGIGVLIGAAIMAMLLTLPIIVAALRSVAQAVGESRAQGAKSNEISPWLLLSGLLGAMLLLFFASWSTAVDVPLWRILLATLVGTLWLGIAGLIVAQATGMTDISPMSGMTLVSVALTMALLGGEVVAALAMGIAISVAVGQSADMMQDLKTGFLVGNRPLQQQALEFSLSWIGVVVAFAVIYALWQGGGSAGGGFGPNSSLPAPQASALAEVIEAVQKQQIPLDKFILGGVAGMVLEGTPVGGLGIMVGLAMYLPFSITLTYGLGCLAQMRIEKIRGYAYAEGVLVPVAAGLIIGEALIGVAEAFWHMGGG
ncbi:OPT/YSL family transporter [Candidatus Magnetaquicoccus inordinatus]|uniref:OPT/YSL family transporter n=1 Tax=Candidatus Magnetaquicoccus inordinatus TaxID=2496818 RepID=UPI00102C29C3|nr:OPT/YSL family transporter [Candidatus Magnetaquicoccus inordinatus]